MILTQRCGKSDDTAAWSPVSYETEATSTSEVDVKTGKHRVVKPVGTVLGWLVMIGLIVAVGSVIDTITNRRT